MITAKRILIIPDVHGRTFWQTPVQEALQNPGYHIVFLGDYHDPYPYEWEPGYESTPDPDYLEHSIERFQEIINLKKQYPDRITLLIGNHDCGYAFDESICSSRIDSVNKSKIRTLFKENLDLFQLAEECIQDGRHVIFSHAGISKGWAREVYGDRVDDHEFNVVDALNKDIKSGDYYLLSCLAMYDIYRGWGAYDFGSVVWADIRSWIHTTPEETFGFNVVGHTQMEKDPQKTDTAVDLDCRRAFYLDETGTIRDYSSGEEI